MPRPEPGLIPVEPLDREGSHAVEYTPDAATLAAMREEFGLVRLDGADLTGTLTAESGRGWRLAGTVTAEVEQSCVVTLEPVITQISEEVERVWLPASEIPQEDEEDADPEAPDGPEPLGDTIDLGSVLHEALALAIDPYPRAPGAMLGSRVFGPEGAEALTDEAARPFAGLAALKAKLGGKG